MSVIMIGAGRFRIAFMPTRLVGMLPEESKKVEEISEVEELKPEEISDSHCSTYGRNGKEIFPEEKGKNINVTI